MNPSPNSRCKPRTAFQLPNYQNEADPHPRLVAHILLLRLRLYKFGCNWGPNDYLDFQPCIDTAQTLCYMLKIRNRYPWPVSDTTEENIAAEA